MLVLENLSKIYSGGHRALSGVNLSVEKGEIFALLGPNGAGKTTLISTICGLVTSTEGSVKVGGFDVMDEFRDARQLIGLVPQELTVDGFESVINTLRFSRSLFGLPRNDAYLDELLTSLSLIEKKNESCMKLSGGMKRRVLIAKALAHEPKLLFLDEPTAGVDVSLRKDMWRLVRELREKGTTIILTTHYIEEAEEMADRVGIISDGKILLVEETKQLMQRMGKKTLTIFLEQKLDQLTVGLKDANLSLADGGFALNFVYDTRSERTGIRSVFALLEKEKIAVADIETHQSSLEEIFVELVGDSA